MAADQKRADRIRALKQDRPDLTWRRIADHVGVTERSATDWQKKGGIDYDNAKKLAELFEVDTDYIWRGPTEEQRAPSPFAGPDAVQDRLDTIDQRLEELLDLYKDVLKHRSKQGTEIIARLDNLERTLAARTDALLPGVRELLAEAQAAQDEAQQQTASTGT